MSAASKAGLSLCPATTQGMRGPASRDAGGITWCGWQGSIAAPSERERHTRALCTFTIYVAVWGHIYSSMKTHIQQYEDTCIAIYIAYTYEISIYIHIHTIYIAYIYSTAYTEHSSPAALLYIYAIYIVCIWMYMLISYVYAIYACIYI
jgi:hypothetical protein